MYWWSGGGSMSARGIRRRPPWKPFRHLARDWWPGSSGLVTRELWLTVLQCRRGLAGGQAVAIARREPNMFTPLKMPSNARLNHLRTWLRLYPYFLVFSQLRSERGTNRYWGAACRLERSLLSLYPVGERLRIVDKVCQDYIQACNCICICIYKLIKCDLIRL